jgi:hypothetical protein
VLESDNPPAILPDGRRLAHAVFISYSSDDTVLANSICAAFEADGIRGWIAPRAVQGGRAYSGQITQAIREARGRVCDSQWIGQPIETRAARSGTRGPLPELFIDLPSQVDRALIG